MLNDQWKTLPDFPNYQVSSSGLVKGRSGKLMKTFIQNQGYVVVSLSNGTGKSIKRTVHRLVSELFIENPNGLPIVNHLDGVKTNNDVSNLEWCDNSHNILHARAMGLNPYNKPTLGKKLPARGSENTSQYFGVCWDKTRLKWKVRIQSNGCVLTQKRFNTELDAAKYHDSYVKAHNLNRPLNFIDLNA